MAESLKLIISALILCLHGVQSQSTTVRTVVACTDPPIIANSNHTTTGLTEGSIVTYSCLPGHEATGSLHKTCRNGVWVTSGAELFCSAGECPTPSLVDRSFHSLSVPGRSYTIGTVVTYNCYSGYVINGSSADIICQANRTWTAPLPTCIKKECGAPPVVTGSNVSYTTTDYYSSAIYSCHKGYDLYNNGFIQRGQSTVRCLSTGLWGNTPTCQPKDCHLPSNILNGMRYSTGNHKYGDSVTYECNHGYEIHGNSSINCLDTGRWSVLPECKKVECDTPPRIANASYALNGKAYFGNSTIYTCSKGFEMTGSAIIYCQADGTWTQKPTCSLVDCRTPPSIHFGVHSWATTTYNSEAEYSCDTGFKLIGVAKIYCKYDGRWTDSPSCELPPGQTAPQPEASQQVSDSSTDNSALTGLAIACALFGVITLLCLIILIYKLFVANKTDKLFSYASYKNGDDVVNSNI